MTNGAGGGYNLINFHGAADLRTLSPENVKTQILDATLQDGPVELQPTSFGLTNARTDGKALQADIDDRILRLAFCTVCHTLFLELGYISQPHAALDHIHQVHTNREGNQVVSLVQSYFQQLMSVARPFTNQREFPISVCAKFMEGLDHRLVTGFRRNFPNHSIVQPLNATHQRKTLQEMLQAAQQAEDDLVSVQRVAREAVGLSQAFVTGGTNVGTAAFPSQAKKTLQRYSPGGGTLTDGSSMVPVGGLCKMAKWVCTLASAVAGHTHGLSIGMVSILWCALTKITQGYWRTPPRTLTECARIGRSVTRRTTRRRTSVRQIFLTLMNQGRSAFGSRSSSPWPGVKSAMVQVWRRPSRLQNLLRQEAAPREAGGVDAEIASLLLMLSFWPQEARSSRPCQSPFKVICHTSS
jgi:hypothetical protein